MAKQRKQQNKITKFADGFENLAARLGIDGDNLLAQSGYRPGKSVTFNQMELDEMYKSSWIVGRMVDVVAADMLRGWVEVQAQLKPGQVDDLRAYTRQMGVQARLLDAVKWARLYGGALAIMLIDGQDLSQPLDYDSISSGSFKGLHVLDRWQVTPSTNLITAFGPMLGYPEHYTINTPSLMGQHVHHSRVIRFVGVELPYTQRIGNQHWGASVVERAYDRIIALDSATHGAANLLYRSFLRVIGVENYRQILAAGGQPEKALLKMFKFISQMQSNEGFTLLDKNDTFTTHGWSFAGIYDALQAFSEQIAGASGIPLVRLLGQSPKGFTTGEGEMQTYYDTILTQQEDGLRPALEVLFNVLARGLWGKPLPDGFAFEFKSLWQPTELEKSQIATADAQNTAGLHAAGIIDKSTALAELRDSARVTGRYSGITDEQISEAQEEESAPALPILPILPVSPDIENAKP